MRPARIEALADAIFAIVMTLLVLELKVPDLVSAPNLPTAISALWPKFLTFVVSFVIVGIYWTSHHIQFGIVKKVTFNFMWLNMLLFLFVALVPFSTALIGTYPLDQLAQTIYGLNLIICGTILYLIWSYARANHLLERDDFSDELRTNVRHKLLIPPTLYLIAILVSLFDTKVSLWFFAAGPLIYFIPIDSKTWAVLTKPL